MGCSGQKIQCVKAAANVAWKTRHHIGPYHTLPGNKITHGLRSRGPDPVSDCGPVCIGSGKGSILSFFARFETRRSAPSTRSLVVARSHNYARRSGAWSSTRHRHTTHVCMCMYTCRHPSAHNYTTQIHDGAGLGADHATSAPRYKRSTLIRFTLVSQ